MSKFALFYKDSSCTILGSTTLQYDLILTSYIYNDIIPKQNQLLEVTCSLGLQLTFLVKHAQLMMYIRQKGNVMVNLIGSFAA